jgi:hypothetical protein
VQQVKSDLVGVGGGGSSSSSSSNSSSSSSKWGGHSPAQFNDLTCQPMIRCHHRKAVEFLSLQQFKLDLAAAAAAAAAAAHQRRGLGNLHPTETAWQSCHSSAVIAAVAGGLCSVQQVGPRAQQR